MDTGQILEAAERLSGLLREMAAQKRIVEAEIAELERLHNDIIHALERPGCKYKERARLATKLAHLRRERRVLKDWLVENTPYLDFLGADDGMKIRNLIDNLVGRGRKVRKQSPV